MTVLWQYWLVLGDPRKSLVISVTVYSVTNFHIPYPLKPAAGYKRPHLTTQVVSSAGGMKTWPSIAPLKDIQLSFRMVS